MLNKIENCNACPRKCNRLRSSVDKGYCQVPDGPMLARAALHYWEEPCISGEQGSGTVFFSGCNLRCVFCQNDVISNGKVGKQVDLARLADIFLELEQKGANNINLVTPSHYIYLIKDAILEGRKKGLKIPIVYNSSAYDSLEELKKLEGIIDIYMPDLKYIDATISARYSRAANYFEVAAPVLDEMYRQCPTAIYDENGIMQKGMIVRHMLLPGQLEDSKNVLKYLYERYGDDIIISIMSQYTPHGDLSDYPEINRKVTDSEYDELIDFALELGIANAFVQDGDVAKESFIPSFDLEGI